MILEILTILLLPAILLCFVYLLEVAIFFKKIRALHPELWEKLGEPELSFSKQSTRSAMYKIALGRAPELREVLSDNMKATMSRIRVYFWALTIFFICWISFSIFGGPLKLSGDGL